MSRYLNLTNTTESKINLENITVSSGTGLESVSGSLYFNGEEVGTGGSGATKFSELTDVDTSGNVQGSSLYYDESTLTWKDNSILKINTASTSIDVDGYIEFENDMIITTKTAMIGVGLGYHSNPPIPGTESIAIGSFSAIGTGANKQGDQSIALGQSAGRTGQGDRCIAVGFKAGDSGQQSNTVAIGFQSGKNTQGINSVAIGYDAGSGNQGDYSIAIGNQAGQTNQSSESIILNAKNNPLNCSTTGLFINPIRGRANSNIQMVLGTLWYDTSNSEVCYHI